MISTIRNSNKVSRVFSNVASKYDELTSFHRNVGEILISKIDNIEDPETILDIGMGTGYLTSRLRDKYSSSKVFGVDFAKGMLQFAKSKKDRILIACADACSLPFAENSFDIIVSNLAYQWVEDLSNAFMESRYCLKEDGRFCFSMFGRNTFKELFVSLDDSLKILEGRDRFPIQKLADLNYVDSSLADAGFNVRNVYSECVKVRFTSMYDLVRWIKNIGANSLKKDAFVGRRLLSKANEFYSTNFSEQDGVFATLEVIYGEAL
ncbi:MAG: methyltransferase domain-containing protein [Candidatus Omnitrophica bacterium]|nr:methyltransferase domain-containing protein [Candidatus Omnitrophota bacterium]MBU1996046.1 methyltransferase domain-containing protein [Candidatus Omnitrophota bacterium]MBU4334047.1 methyltransferase domain-containing protein [Candidatus Omnitrophota bacterium]